MCLSDIYTLGGSLQRLLSTLKINRERVPLETLKSVYRVPYEELKAQIREGVQEFVLLVACGHLLINPDYPPDEQTAAKGDRQKPDQGLRCGKDPPDGPETAGRDRSGALALYQPENLPGGRP